MPHRFRIASSDSGPGLTVSVLAGKPPISQHGAIRHCIHPTIVVGTDRRYMPGSAEEFPSLTIIPIFCREMMAARGRQSRLQSARAGFAVELSLMVVGAFAAWYYWAGGVLDSLTMARIANEVPALGRRFHAGDDGHDRDLGRRSIAEGAGQPDARLRARHAADAAPRSCWASSPRAWSWPDDDGAGLPVMLLLHVLGGIELRVDSCALRRLRVGDRCS